MPSLELEIKVVGADDGADQLKNFASSAKDAGDDVKTAGTSISSTTRSLSDFKSNLAGVVGSFTAISTGVLGLVRNFTQMEQAQVRLDTANRRVETSAQAVEKAQKNLNDAIAKYGPTSDQARTAADKLKTTIEGHNIAVDRANLQQQKFNETLASLATEVVPQVIGVFGSIVSAISSFTTKGEAGVSLAGKLKQSFLDLVSGGSNVKSSLDTAGNSMGGLGTKAEAAGKSAGTLESEVAQLGTGIAGAVPNMERFGGGITNTAAAAERSVGPLGNIERTVASTAAEVGGAVAPLGAFAGGLGSTGTAAEGVVGGLEAAATSTGALEGGTVAATAATAGLETGILGISAATAAETAGISLAVAALILYITNIGGFRDKTNAAIDTANKFLAIGWSSFTKKFEPVTKAIEGGTKALEDFIGKAGEAAKLDISGQFKKQPAPGQALGPSGRPLDETIAAENPAIAKGTAGILNMVNAMKQLAEQKTQMEGLSKTGVANSNANAAAFAGEGKSIAQLAQESQQEAAAEKARQAAAQTAANAAKANADANKVAAEAITRLRAVSADLEEQEKSRAGTLAQLSKALADNAGQISANNQILTSAAGQQSLYTKGVQEEVLALQNAQQTLITSGAALDTLNKNLDVAKITAYKQGWIDFNTTMDQTIVKTSNAQGQFDAWISSLTSSASQMAQFNKGFTEGEQSIQKWVESLAQTEGQMGGTRSALEQLAQQWQIQLPQAVNASNQVLQAFISSIHQTTDAMIKGFEGADKTLDSAEKQYQKFLDAVNKPIQAGQTWQDFMQQRQKAWQDELDFELKTFGHFLSETERQGLEGMTKLVNDMNTSLQGLNLDLGLGDMPDFQKNWKQAIDNMIADTKRLPTGMQGPWNQVIEMIKQMPVDTPQHAATAMNFFQAAVQASQSPSQNLNPVINSMQGYLAGIGKTEANKNVDAFGKASSGATSGVDGLGNSMSTLTANTGFAASALDALKKNFLDPMTSTTLTIKVTADTGSATSALDTIKTQYVDKMTSTTLTIKVTADTGAATSALDTLLSQYITPLKTQITITPQANTGAATSALDTFITNYINPLKQSITITPQANTGPATSAISTLQGVINQLTASQQIIQITANTGPAASAIQALQASLSAMTTNQHIIQITANTGPAASAIGALQNTITAMTGNQHIIQITANTGPAASAIGALQNSITAMTGAQHIIQITANTGPAASAIGALQNSITAMTNAQHIVQITANTGPAASAIQTLQNTIRALVQQTYTITVTANTGPAASAIDALQQKLNALRSTGAGQGVPIGFARYGGNFSLGGGGFSKMQPGEQLNAARGGSFVVTRRTKIANLTVGEGDKPELVTFVPGAGSNGMGMLHVAPMKKFFAQAGGSFGFGPGGTVTPGFGPGGGMPTYGFGPGGTVTPGFGPGGGPSGYPTFPGGDGGVPVPPSNIPPPNDAMGQLTGLVPLMSSMLQTERQQLSVDKDQNRGLDNIASIFHKLTASGGPQQLFAQAGGMFNFAAGGPAFMGGLIPGYSSLPQTGGPIDYGAGLPPIVQGQGGVPVTQPGQYGAPDFGALTGGGGGSPFGGFNMQGGYSTLPPTGLPIEYGAGLPPLIQGQGGVPVTSISQQGPTGGGGGGGSGTGVSPYEFANLTGNAVASEIEPGQRQMQTDMSSLLAMIRKLLRQIGTREVNANLMIDGQKMANTVSKYIGSGAYGGR